MATAFEAVELPYPPSVNRYYRRVGPRTLISREGRRYREQVEQVLRARGTELLIGDLHMIVHLYPPDARRRDLDNVQKALWDALQHGGLYQDDGQIKQLEAHMYEPMPPNGLAIVTVRRRP